MYILNVKLKCTVRIHCSRFTWRYFLGDAISRTFDEAFLLRLHIFICCMKMKE